MCCSYIHLHINRSISSIFERPVLFYIKFPALQEFTVRVVTSSYYRWLCKDIRLAASFFYANDMVIAMSGISFI